MFTLPPSRIMAPGLLPPLLLLVAVACGGSEPAKPATPPPAPPAAPVAAAPVAPAAPAAPAAGPADGETIYKTYCLPCHGSDGRGNNGLAANYVDDKTRLAQPDEALFASIKNGKTGTVGTMPPWGGTLSDDQIKAVLGYVRTSFGSPSPK